MMLILRRRWDHVSRSGVILKSYPMGQIVQCDKELTKELIDSGTAEPYKGKYPPEGKTKTDFFKKK